MKVKSTYSTNYFSENLAFISKELTSESRSLDRTPADDEGGTNFMSNGNREYKSDVFSMLMEDKKNALSDLLHHDHQ